MPHNMLRNTPRNKTMGLLLKSCVGAVALMCFAACSTSDNHGGSQTQAQKKSSVDSLLQQALNEAEAKGNTQEKIAILEKVYSRSPDDTASALRYAKALREDGQLDKARLVLTPIINNKTKDAAILTEFSVLQLELGQYESARENALKAIDIDPKDGRAHLVLGTTFDAVGQHRKAELSFRQGLKYWKGDPAPILNNLALNLASQGYLEESLSLLQKAQSASPKRPEIERNIRIIRTLIETSPKTAKAGSKPAPAPLSKPPEILDKKQAVQKSAEARKKLQKIRKEKKREEIVRQKLSAPDTKKTHPASASSAKPAAIKKGAPAEAVPVKVTPVKKAPQAEPVKAEPVKAKPAKTQPEKSQPAPRNQGQSVNMAPAKSIEIKPSALSNPPPPPQSSLKKAGQNPVPDTRNNLKPANKVEKAAGKTDATLEKIQPAASAPDSASKDHKQK